MPPSSEPADGAPAPRPAPPSARVAVGLLALLAVLLLLNSGLTWFGREILVDRVLEARSDVTRSEAERFVLLSVVPYFALGLLLLISAIWLARRQAWARWVGLAATVLLLLLTLVSLVGAGGVSAVSLLVLVLGSATVASLLVRTTSEWLPRLRADR